MQMPAVPANNRVMLSARVISIVAGCFKRTMSRISVERIFAMASNCSGLSEKTASRIVYIIGKTGTGKSTLIETMALQDFWSAETALHSSTRTATWSSELPDRIPQLSNVCWMSFSP